MTGKKHYGDPRKNDPQAGSKKRRGTSKRELSIGFIFLAWFVFFGIWLAAGSLLVAAIVFGLLMSAAIGVLNAR
jgi:uncharacterized membrane protein YccF (DUF307 family)